jgi:drug/metabolite transporter (DMT)-like permease
VITASVVALILWQQKVAFRVLPAQRKYLGAVGLLIAVQSVCLYSAVARLPVALALLGFNTYPLWTAFWDRVLYGRRTERAVLQAMPVILLGLALALDVMGASSGLGAADQWQQMGVGVAFAITAGAVFGLALVWTQHETQGMDGRVRTIATMSLSGVVALAVMAGQGGPHWPQTTMGWGGMAALTFLYGTAFTIMFTVLPRLGVVGNSAIMNVEPVFALTLAWALLDQAIAPIQLVGAALVVGTVMWLGLRKR